MRAFLLAGALVFTLPVWDGTPCAPDFSHPITRCTFWSLWGRRQSVAWRDSSAVMLADPRAWERLWPRVKAEAEPVRVERTPVGYGASAVTFTPPAPAWPFYHVTTENEGGLESCPSNVVGWP